MPSDAVVLATDQDSDALATDFDELRPTSPLGKRDGFIAPLPRIASSPLPRMDRMGGMDAILSDTLAQMDSLPKYGDGRARKPFRFRGNGDAGGGIGGGMSGMGMGMGPGMELGMGMGTDMGADFAAQATRAKYLARSDSLDEAVSSGNTLGVLARVSALLPQGR